jgi:hypothetical protein
MSLKWLLSTAEIVRLIGVGFEGVTEFEGKKLEAKVNEPKIYVYCRKISEYLYLHIPSSKPKIGESECFGV